MVDFALANSQQPLAVEGLTKTFGSRRVVTGIDMVVMPGSITGLLGPNGSGKSTTLHCLTGYYRPTEGKIFFSGLPADDAFAKNEFGFFPDDLPYPAALTANELIRFHRELRPLFDLEFVLEMTEILGLSEDMNKFLGDYSHGMRRKIQLALALAHHPRLLILDEPLRGLDPEAGALMNSTLIEFTRMGGSVLMATHDLLNAQEFCDSITILNHGTVVASGSPKSVMEANRSTSLLDAFVRLTHLDGRVDEARSRMDQLLNKYRLGDFAQDY